MSVLLHNNKKIHYKRSGSGKRSIVFVHGFTCDCSDWQNQVAHFEPECDVVCIDVNGHGQSTLDLETLTFKEMAEDVIALVEHLGLSKPALVGHSMGCRITLQALALRPEMFSVGALIDGSRACDPKSYDAVSQQGTQLLDSLGYQVVLQGLFESMFLNCNDESFKARVIQRALGFPESAVKEAVAQLFHWDAFELEGALELMELPLLVVQTSDETPDGGRKMLKKGDTTIWLDVISEHTDSNLLTIEIIEDTSHFPMHDQPKQLNQLLDAFLAAH